MSDPKASEAAMGKPHFASQSTDKFDRLKAILREMFQLDRGDLDFGLYRIMNLKAGEIASFLDNDLLPQVRTALAGNTTDRLGELEEELAEARGQARDLGVDPETTPKVEELKRQLAEAKADVAAETDVYNHLANFFARYYDEGDFMSLRRYSGGGQPTYLIPYDGEEVKLHWANADQYYVKTTENYSSYVFAVGTSAETRRVRFEIAAADNEKDNVKEANGKQRRFLLAGDKADAITFNGADLVVRFAHRPLTDHEKKEFPGNGAKQQDGLNEAIAKRILQALPPDRLALLTAPAPTENNPERTVLDKHLAAYTAKNSFDYFIHKDLGEFLRRELDFYLKSEVLNLDDLALVDAARLGRALARMRAVRHVADKIIDFLAQLENFQKQLWLKKKFILETQYCVTLDRVPEALYEEIAANESQRGEWVTLFAIDEIQADLGNGGAGYSEPLSKDFLKANPFLVLDTQHFGADFTGRLLAGLSEAGPLDEQLDGLLVHGENFQALNLLKARYRGQVKCIYIDPPYNTGNDEFIYKDRYKHSSWLSMMNERIVLARQFLRFDGTFFTSVDFNEISVLKTSLDVIFGENLEGLISWRRRHNQPNDPTKMIGLVAEYLLAYARDATALRESGVGKVDLTGKYANPDNDPRGDWSSKPWKSGSGQSGTRYVIKTPKGRKLDEEWMGDESTYKTLLADNRIIFLKKGDGSPRKKYFKSEREEEGQCATNWWEHSSFGDNAGANATLTELFGIKNLINNPKPLELIRGVIQVAGHTVDLVMDFFSGSGTTGHAIINLHRTDGEMRKYILVEVAQYFDTVLLPRMKKVVYSSDWKDGKPVSHEGVSQFFKYVRLESYEDTLDSLEVTPPDSAQQDLLAGNPTLAEDYRLRYALGEETAGSACLLGKGFTDPFAYTLSVVRDGVRREVSVDLSETFNYLLGLRVESRRRMDGVLTITGINAEGQQCLILWRNLNETDNAALETWFTNHRAEFSESLDAIYTNGDHTLNALKQPNETWTAKTIEPVFRELMFEETE